MLNRILQKLAPNNTRDDASNEERVRVATCVLLLEIAHAEDGFSEEEHERIREILVRRFNLSPQETADVIEAAEEARRDSHDLFRFTNGINRGCTPEEKRQIIREVWRVIYADGHLSGHEDHLVHRMATLLNLNHPQLIAEKMAAREEMKGDEGGEPPPKDPWPTWKE